MSDSKKSTASKQPGTPKGRWINTAVITVFLTAVVGPMALAYSKNQQETKRLQVEIMRQMIASVADTEFLGPDGLPISNGMFQLAATATLVTQNEGAIGLDFSEAADRLVQIAQSLDRSRVKELEAMKAELEETKQLLEADISAMEERRTELEKERKELLKSAEQRGEEVAFYQKNRNANRKLIESLDRRLEAANQLRERYEDDLALKSEEISGAKEDLIRLAAEAASKEKHVAGLEAALKKRDSELTEVKRQQLLLEGDLERIDGELRTANEELQKREQKVVHLENERHKLRKKNQQLEAEIARLNAPARPSDSSDQTPDEESPNSETLDPVSRMHS